MTDTQPTLLELEGELTWHEERLAEARDKADMDAVPGIKLDIGKARMKLAQASKVAALAEHYGHPVRRFT